MNAAVVISIPISAALIGWIMSCIAIKMLFRPRRPVRFAGISFHGVVPRRRPQLAAGIAKMIESELISHDDIRAFLERPENHRAVEAVIEEQVDIFLNQRVASNPMLAMFLQRGLGTQIRDLLLVQFRKAIPVLVETLTRRLEAGVDFQDIIRQKIEAVELSKLEETIARSGARELRTLQVLGGASGFVIGILQLIVMLALD